VGGGGPWVEISGTVSMVGGTTQARASGEVYTFDGDMAIVTVGKRQPMDLTFSVVYTEELAEAYEVLRALFEEACGEAVYIRWAPRGGDTGENHISTAKGYITSWDYPPMDASNGGPIVCSVTIRTSDVTTVTETT